MAMPVSAAQFARLIEHNRSFAGLVFMVGASTRGLHSFTLELNLSNSTTH
jgi:hypothetical protein